ncbi:MAG: hypothetical protein M3Q45_02640, partial [Chloroflexota bacterium]|nr:hypothetical protein [Chloroflexota bacterium]
MARPTRTRRTSTRNAANTREVEAGPLARQQAFLQERLVTAEASGTRGVVQPVGAAAPPPAATRLDRLTEYRTRQQEARVAAPSPSLVSRGVAAAAVTIDYARTNRWTPIGPAVVRQGQGGKEPAVSGRVRGIAVTPGGGRIYVATANGGVWRSEDGGRAWLSLMDAFDLNPTQFRADSLACGAIALAPGTWAGQDTIYVGSGEPGVSADFQGDSAFFGMGPIVSTDGGLNWVTEPATPPLLGQSCYALAVDPTDSQRVVAATGLGLYRRELDGQNGFHWVRQIEGIFCSVVVAQRGGVSTFYAARWAGDLFKSTDGATWTPAGTGFPSADVARIGLAVQADNPDVVYALACKGFGHLHGVYRLTVADGKWRPVRNIPATLFGPDLNRWGQGTYDLAIAVAPDDVNRLYIGGSIVLSDGIKPAAWGDWSGSLYRCEITVNTQTKNASAAATYIGGSIHGDLHTLVFAPGDANQLWVGCDGGVFHSSKPTVNPLEAKHADGLFEARNTGLATLTMNYLSQHPTEEAVLFCGTQDNGGLRYT